MGQSGCPASKSSADIIILDDNFRSVKDAVKWGRNIFDNARKVVQFQISVNIVCLSFIFISVLSFGNSPLNVIQLLWINFIMDLLAAIALATEHPIHLKEKSVKNGDSIIDLCMWRQIYAQVIY